METSDISDVLEKDMLNISKWSEFFPKFHAAFREHALHE